MKKITAKKLAEVTEQSPEFSVYSIFEGVTVSLGVWQYGVGIPETRTPYRYAATIRNARFDRRGKSQRRNFGLVHLEVVRHDTGEVRHATVEATTEFDL